VNHPRIREPHHFHPIEHGFTPSPQFANTRRDHSGDAVTQFLASVPELPSSRFGDWSELLALLFSEAPSRGNHPLLQALPHSEALIVPVISSASSLMLLDAPRDTVSVQRPHGSSVSHQQSCVQQNLRSSFRHRPLWPAHRSIHPHHVACQQEKSGPPP